MAQVYEFNAALVAHFYPAEARAWGLSVDAFRQAVAASVAHTFAGRAPSRDELNRCLAALHARDLALATACALGHAAAWDTFVAEHQAGLRRGADALDASGSARDLADSLLGELFGVREQGGARQSLFHYFHGRSSLSTWLRAVLSQRYVDRLRAHRKMEPLPDDDTMPSALRAMPAADTERAQFIDTLRRALTAALAALAPRDRLRLACYYVQYLTLAAIGRVLGEHEATVSRHLARTRADLRAATEARLRDTHGLDAAAIHDCIRAAVEDPGALDLARILSPVGADAGPDAARKNQSRDRSKEEETGSARQI